MQEEIRLALVIVSKILFVFIPLRQFNSRYFVYYTIIAAGGMLSYLAVYEYTIHNDFIFVAVSFFSFAALVNYNKSGVQLLLAVLFAAGVLSLVPEDWRVYILYVAVLEVMVLVIFISHFLNDFADKNEINFFYIANIFYVLLSALKFLNYLTFNAETRLYFYFSSFLQLASLVYLLIYRPDKPKLAVKFGKYE